MILKRLVPLLVLTTTLSGCFRYDAASFMADHNTSVTLEIGKPLPWGDWKASLIFQNAQVCQRRHSLDAAGVQSPKLDFFLTAPGLVSIRLEKLWYVADLNNCWMQAYKDPPPSPGPYLGSFEEVSKTYVFTASAKH